LRIARIDLRNLSMEPLTQLVGRERREPAGFRWQFVFGSVPVGTHPARLIASQRVQDFEHRK